MKSSRKLVTAGFAASVGGAIGAGSMALLEASGVWGPSTSWWQGFLLLVVAFLVNVLVHELGHVVSGVRAGFDFRALGVGPLVFERGRGLRWQRSPALGFVWLTPPIVRDLPDRMRRMIAGGLMMGFAFGAVSLLLAVIVPPGPWRGFWCLCALLSAVLNGVSAWPSFGGGLLSDGARLKRLRRGSRTARAEAALLALYGLGMSGYRPRDWPEVLVDEALGPQGAVPFDAASANMAFYAALDAGDELAAELHLSRAEELMTSASEVLRAGLHLDRAYLEARRGQPRLARAALRRARRSAFVAESTRARAEAAVLLAEGQPRLALLRAEQGLRQVTSGLSMRGVEQPWLTTIRNEALRASRGPART